MGVESRIGAAGMEEGLGGAGGEEEDSQDERNGAFCAVIVAGEKLADIVVKIDIDFVLAVGIILPCRSHGSSS
jgi:hypothetical protein